MPNCGDADWAATCPRCGGDLPRPSDQGRGELVHWIAILTSHGNTCRGS